MTRLTIVRHAKSDWGDPLRDDHDRALNERGLRDAPMMAARLAARMPHVDAILSSTALRAVTTAEFFSGALGVPVEQQERLYGAPAAVLLRAAAERDVSSVVVVAHDPGMTALAAELSRGGITQMPTCAVATFEWGADSWDIATAVEPDDWEWDAPR